MGPGNNVGGLCDAITQCESLATLDKVVSGKATSCGSIIVRIERYSVKTLDIDNFAGGLKPLIDSLCSAKLIADDSPSDIELSFQQFKVPHLKDKKTVIKIRYPR